MRREKIRPHKYSRKILKKYLSVLERHINSAGRDNAPAQAEALRGIASRRGNIKTQPGPAGDISAERIHQIRVSGRRLRAFFWVFRGFLSAKERKRAVKFLRRTARKLGPLRDLDVLLDFVKNLRRETPVPRERAALLAVAEALEKQRAAKQPQARLALRQAAESGLLRLMKKAGKKYPRKKTKNLSALGRKRIIRRLEALTRAEAAAHAPASTDELHRIRIAAKKLRYTLEIFRGVYGAPLDEFLGAAHHIQNLLGLVHDLDVWQSYFSRPRLTGRERIFNEGAGLILRRCRSLRRQTCAEFAVFRRELKRKQFWRKLVFLLEHRDTEDGRHKDIK